MIPYLLFIPTSILAGITVLTSHTDPLTFLLNYGVLGIIVILAATGFISFKPHIVSLEKRIDAQAEIIKEFQIAARGATTSLGRTTEVLEALPHNDDASVTELKTLISRLEELAGPSAGVKR